MSAKATATAQGREDTANAPGLKQKGECERAGTERERAGEEVALGWT